MPTPTPHPVCFRRKQGSGPRLRDLRLSVNLTSDDAGNASVPMKDIRDLKEDKEAYAAELERRWTSLLSYRYIGRRYGSMDVGAEGDSVVNVRSDFRNSTGGLLVAPIAISSPESGGLSDLEAVPNPVIHSACILDPGYDVKRIEVRSETLKVGRQMGFSRSRIVDADHSDRVIAFTEGQGISLGGVPRGLEKMPEPHRDRRLARPAAPLGSVRRLTSTGRPLGFARTLRGVRLPDAALHLGPQHVVLEVAAVDLAADLGYGSAPVANLARHVPRPGQDRALPCRWRSGPRRRWTGRSAAVDDRRRS